MVGFSDKYRFRRSLKPVFTAGPTCASAICALKMLSVGLAAPAAWTAVFFWLTCLQQLCQTKVQNFAYALAGKKNVRRLDVAMNDPRARGRRAGHG
jgi:hypothetical protein